LARQTTQGVGFAALIGNFRGEKGLFGPHDPLSAVRGPPIPAKKILIFLLFAQKCIILL